MTEGVTFEGVKTEGPTEKLIPLYDPAIKERVFSRGELQPEDLLIFVHEKLLERVVLHCCRHRRTEVGGVLVGGYHIYNLGESQPVSLSDLIGSIEEALGKEALINRLPPQPGDVQSTYADVSLARQELGYQPATDLKTGLAKFVAWLRAEPAHTERQSLAAD